MACEKVKAWLSQAGVDFVAHNVETDIAAYDALLALGVRVGQVRLFGRPGAWPPPVPAELPTPCALTAV